MKNQITASVEFYFKGIRYAPTLVLDLDEMMQREGEIPEDLHRIIAEANEMGTYTYEFEMMEAEEIYFSDAQGLAADFIDNGEFDIVGFEMAWHHAQDRQLFAELAHKHLAIDNLDAHPEIEAALTEAYRRGKTHR